LSTTVQDLGRHGFQRLGVAVGGALDPVSFCAANALVGNPSNVGALEVLYVGPTLSVEAEDVRLAFVGADAPIEILSDGDATNVTRVPAMQSIRLRRGQIIRVGSLRNGACLYVAVEGGFAVDSVLGSVATDSRGKMGGWKGRAIIDGDLLPLCRISATERRECRIGDLDLDTTARFRTVLGPQSGHFGPDEIDRFFANEYVVTAGSNRMGLRLEGTPVRHLGSFNIVSDAIVTGSIQVSGSGQPIVLLADHQTTGGYPKIATVISADLPALGRLTVGSKMTFTPVTIEEATAARRQLLTTLDQIAQRIVPVQTALVDVAARLLEFNLISGVCDAAA